jgi:hypothetical protein
VKRLDKDPNITIENSINEMEDSSRMRASTTSVMKAKIELNTTNTGR